MTHPTLNSIALRTFNGKFNFGCYSPAYDSTEVSLRDFNLVRIS